MKKYDAFEKALLYNNVIRVKEGPIFLALAQDLLEVGPTEMAKLLDTNFNTYKAWLYDKNPLPKVVRIAVTCLIRERFKLSP